MGLGMSIWSTRCSRHFLDSRTALRRRVRPPPALMNRSAQRAPRKRNHLHQRHGLSSVLRTDLPLVLRLSPAHKGINQQHFRVGTHHLHQLLVFRATGRPACIGAGKLCGPSRLPDGVERDGSLQRA